MIQLVGPYAPHLADEAWAHLGEKGFVLEAAWPSFDDALTMDDASRIGVQVDGKLRGSVELAADATEETARARRRWRSPNVTKHLEGRVIKKFFYRPGKIISIASAPA